MTTIQIILLSIGGILSIIGWGFLLRDVIYGETNVFPLICFLISIFFLILNKVDISLECLLIILYIILIVPSYYFVRYRIRKKFPIIEYGWEWTDIWVTLMSSIIWPIGIFIILLITINSSPPKWL